MHRGRRPPLPGVACRGTGRRRFPRPGIAPPGIAPRGISLRRITWQGIPRRGFTLIELLVAMAIVAILLGTGFWRFHVQRQRMTVSEAARQFRVRVERARTIAMGLGGFLGNAALFQNCVNLPPPWGSDVALAIDSGTGTYTVPVGVQFNSVSGAMQTQCAQVNVPVASRGRAQIQVTPPTTVVAFTATGRLDPTVTPGPIHVMFQRVDESGSVPEPELGTGFRILSSGVVCQAATASTGCDEDAVP